MKKYLLIFAAAAIGTILVACGSGIGGSGTPNPTVGAAASCNGAGCGEFLAASDQNSFQQAMTVLSGNPGLGSVSGQEGQQTGVRFAGSAAVTGGVDRTGMTNAGTQMVSGGTVSVYFYDSNYLNNGALTQMSLPVLNTSYVSGNFAIIQAQNATASIVLEGNFGVFPQFGTQSMFVGQVLYDNGPYPSPVEFVIPTCPFFNCR